VLHGPATGETSYETDRGEFVGRGRTLADPAAIIANSGLKVGDEFAVPGDLVAQAIRRLWGLRLFEDIQVSIDRKLGNGVYLVITVKELPRFDRAENAMLV